MKEMVTWSDLRRHEKGNGEEVYHVIPIIFIDCSVTNYTFCSSCLNISCTIGIGIRSTRYWAEIIILDGQKLRRNKESRAPAILWKGVGAINRVHSLVEARQQPAMSAKIKVRSKH